MSQVCIGTRVIDPVVEKQLREKAENVGWAYIHRDPAALRAAWESFKECEAVFRVKEADA